MSARLCPVHCIVPPHMLQEIEQRGSPAQRDVASRMVALSDQVRRDRVAVLGEIAAQATAAPSAGKQRIVYDATYGSDLPGSRMRGEGDPPSGDSAVNEAYDGSGATYDLYADVYGRDSIDNGGMRLDSTVHYQRGYDNAFWNGRQMVYGDGDEDLPESERLFNRFTTSIDIIGHELTHGVTEYEARLVYRDQSGALNESFSDVFGSLVKQRVHDQTADQADWIIGAGLFTPNVTGDGIRSMSDPGTAYNDPVLGEDPQPAHMRDYREVDYDNGGVHINSGIPNRAFHLAAREIGGYAWDKAGRIWYVTLRDKLRARSGFQNAADLTFQTAGEQFGTGSLEQQAVRKGWGSVGIDVDVHEDEPPPQKGMHGGAIGTALWLYKLFRCYHARLALPRRAIGGMDARAL